MNSLPSTAAFPLKMSQKQKELLYMVLIREFEHNPRPCQVLFFRKFDKEIVKAVKAILNLDL